MMVRWVCLVSLTMVVSGMAREVHGSTPKPSEDPLLPSEVLAASERHFPKILASLAELRGAAGRVLEAQGAFDLVFDAEGFSRVDGFYDGTALQGVAKQRLPGMGAEVYGGYGISNGTFPIYEDQFYTDTGGTLKAGAVFNLLRNRDTDRERMGVQDARIRRQAAELDVLLTKIGVQQRALVAYWRWVALGRQVNVYADLLRIATERQVGLIEQVRRGAVAEIFLTENQQNIARRQVLVTASRRDLMKAGNALSFYFRDDEGRPQEPGIARLPSPDQLGKPDDPAVLPDEATANALDRRPELDLLRATIIEVQNDIALAENELKPRLDFGVELQQGFGAVGEGGPSRPGTDAIVGLTFSVPMQQRAAKGRLAAAQAELQATAYERQLREDQIELEVRNILLELAFARQLQQLAEVGVQQSDIMRDSEIRRFESGASDFFLVNVREETAANARITLLEAELQTRIARADYDAAVVDLRRLGITPISQDDDPYIDR